MYVFSSQDKKICFSCSHLIRKHNRIVVVVDDQLVNEINMMIVGFFFTDERVSHDD